MQSNLNIKKILKWLVWTIFVTTFLFLFSTQVQAAQIYTESTPKTVISGQIVNDNLIIMTSDVNIEGTINGDLFVLANSLKISGQINGNLIAAASDVQISGQISKDVFILASSLNLQSGTQIQNLYALSRQISQSPEAKILNQNVQKQKLFKTPKTTAQAIYNWLISYLGILIVGMLLIYAAPVKTKAVIAKIKEKPWLSALYGLIFLILVPIVSILLLATIIGLPLGLIFILLYILAIYLSKIFVGLLLGKYILGEKTKVAISLALGLLILTLLFKAPIVGGFISFVSIILATGAMALEKYQKLKEAKR